LTKCQQVTAILQLEAGTDGICRVGQRRGVLELGHTRPLHVVDNGANELKDSFYRKLALLGALSEAPGREQPVRRPFSETADGSQHLGCRAVEGLLGAAILQEPDSVFAQVDAEGKPASGLAVFKVRTRSDEELESAPIRINERRSDPVGPQIVLAGERQIVVAGARVWGAWVYVIGTGCPEGGCAGLVLGADGEGMGAALRAEGSHVGEAQGESPYLVPGSIQRNGRCRSVQVECDVCQEPTLHSSHRGLNTGA
jgi:hypothetical protein